MGPSKPPRPHQGATFKGLNANQQAWKGSIRPFPVGADSIQAKPGLVQSIPKPIPRWDVHFWGLEND